jgi:hypothetical protein
MAPIPSFQQGTLAVVPPAALEAQLAQQQLARSQALAPPEPAPPELAGWVRGQFEIFRNHRNTAAGWSNRLLEALRTFNGQYSPTKFQEVVKFGGSQVYARLSAQKCRAASSLLRDIYLGADLPWTINPPSDPTVPPDVIQKIDTLLGHEQQMIMRTTGQTPDPQDVARRRMALLEQASDKAKQKAADQAAIAEDKIEEFLREGGFYHALAEFLVDLPIFPFACIKGPSVKIMPEVSWQNGQATVRQIPKLTWSRVSPFDLWWTPGVGDIANACVIEKSRLTRGELNDLLDLPGFDHDEVRAVLDEYGRGGLYDNWDTTDAERAVLESRENPAWNRSGLITQMEYHGNVQGRILQDYGMPGVADELRDYHVDVYVIGSHVIKATLSPSPRARHPYFITSFEKVPGTPVGNGLTDLIADLQDVANATLRSLVNNLCLTGDTVVYRHPRTGPGTDNRRGVGAKRQPRGKAEITLQALFDESKGHNSGLRRNIIRSLNPETGEIIGQRIEAIHDNGVQDVYEIVTARGYRIEATGPHKFLADGGDWRQVRHFKIGDLIGVNGSVVPLPRHCETCGGPIGLSRSRQCRSCSRKAYHRSVGHTLIGDCKCVECGAQLSRKGPQRCRSCSVKATTEGSWNQRQAQAALTNRKASETTARYRKLVQMQAKPQCEGCGSAIRLQIHHIDRDPWNCEPSNLRTYCDPCHKAWHVRHGRFGDPYKHRFLDFDRIESIRHTGRKQTFCLTMQGFPNFVANGYISRNSISSGPQAVIHDDRVRPEENTDDLYPWKRWHVVNDPIGNNNKPPVEFFQPQSNAQDLLTVFKAFVDISDDVSAIPKYIGGQASGGAGRTASGLAMLMGNAAKILQTVAANIDRDIFEQALTSLVDLVLLTDTTGLLTGEENVSVQGVSVAVQRETQRQRQLEFLQHTGNPIDMSIIGIKGRGAVLRSVAKTIGLVGEDIVPDDDDLAKQQQAQQQQGPQQALGQQVEKGIAAGLELGTQKIVSEIIAGVLARQVGVPGGGSPPSPPAGQPPPGGAAPPGGFLATLAAQAQGNQPSPLSNQQAQPANVVGNQPAPPAPGARPPAIGGGPG